MLEDGLGRRVEYLRLSVTDRCDLRCSYCMPPGFKDYEEPGNWLNFDELERLVAVLAGLGVKRIRMTGGEPLLRRNLPELAQRLARLPGVEDLSLSTNGTRLKQNAAALRAAGVTRLNVSLDSLDPERVHKITGRDVLPQIFDGLEAAWAQSFRVIKINMVVLPEVRDGDIDAMVEYCGARGFVLRFIEMMPVGDTGRRAGYVDLRPLRERLRSRFGLVDGMVPGGGPARYLMSPDGCHRLGFITPISQHFCETCNRVRLSVEGMLYLCLGQEDAVDFRELLRSGCDDEQIAARFRAALQAKPARHEFRERPERVVRFMSSTGG